MHDRTYLSDVNVEIRILDAETGEVLQEHAYHNRVVNAGRNLLRDFLAGDAVSTLTHFALGDSSTAVSAGQTTMVNEVFRDSITQKSKTGTGETKISQFLSSGQANGYTLREAGLFNASSGGVMFARVTFDEIVKSSAVAITFDWTVSIEGVV